MCYHEGIFHVDFFIFFLQVFTHIFNYALHYVVFRIEVNVCKFNTKCTGNLQTLSIFLQIFIYLFMFVCLKSKHVYKNRA